MTDDLKYHEVHIRHYDGSTAPRVIHLGTGPAFVGGEPIGLVLKTTMDPHRPGTMLHSIDAQSIVGALDTPERVADYLDTVAQTIRQAHLYASTDDRKAP